VVRAPGAGRSAAWLTGPVRRARCRLSLRRQAPVSCVGSYYRQGETLYFQSKVTDAVHRKLLYALDPASGAIAAPSRRSTTCARVMERSQPPSSGRVEVTWGEQRPPTYEAYREFMAGF